MNTPETVIVDSLLLGRTRPFGPSGELSGIDKQALDAPVSLSASGLAGDEQGDTRYHGGSEKALHHYAAEHYGWWRDELPEVAPSCWKAGAFGENLSTTGLTEGTVCVGDIFRLGTARIQVSQARQPCWKLNLRFACKNMAERVQAARRTGWYYRVLEGGEIAPGARLSLLERPCPDWPLARLLHYFYRDMLDQDALRALAALETLSPSWRTLAEQRLLTGKIEDWQRRLNTPEKS